MDKKYVLLVLCSVILLACFVGSVSAKTWYVDDDGIVANFTRIQDAIDNATAGDTIIVSDGTYIENIEVDKSLTIQSVKGSDYTVIQAEDPDDSIFRVNEDHVNISGFTVKGADTGIYLNYTDQCTISNNICSNNGIGIYLLDSSNNTIINNTVSSNSGYGIHLMYSSNNAIIDNTFSSNSGYGIYLLFSSNDTITGNTFVNDGIFVYNSYHNTVENNTVNNKPLVYLEDASDYTVEDAGQVILLNCTNITVENLDLSNTSVGIELWKTSNSKISNNVMSNNNDEGIYLRDSSNNTISGNNVSNNLYRDIYLVYSSNNTITCNNVSDNDTGIYLSNSNDNTITGNNVSNNLYNGIYLRGSSNNTITNNAVSNNGDGIYLRDSSSNNHIYLNDFMNNSDNAYSKESTNIWNSAIKLNYTYNGSTFTNQLGNYWDDYEERYPDSEGIDATGIWNTPYDIDGDSDKYPLIEPFENYILE